MKRLLTVTLLCLLVTSPLQSEQILPVDPGKYLNQPSLIGYVPNEFVVIRDDNAAVDHSRDRQSRVATMGLSDFDQLADRYSVTTLRPQSPGSDRADRGGDVATRSLARHYKVRFDSGNLDEVTAAYAALPTVKRVEPIGIHALYATPNDTYYDNPPAEFPYDQLHYWDTYGYVDHMYIAYSTEPSARVANFSESPTSGTYPLTVQFTDRSTGAPTSWNWDSGDGGTSTSQNPSHQYQAAGTYTVSLTVSSEYGSDVETKSNYITVSEPPVGGTMHVQNMVAGRTNAGVKCSGTATITVFDSNGQPVSGATVNANATGPVGGSFSGTTGTDGNVQFTTGKTKCCTGEWCFEVTAVPHASLTYEPSSNLVTKACESGWVYGEGAGMSASLPHEFGLMQNYPNPFNPITEISFAIPSTSHATLKVYNITGQHIETLVDGVISAGFHTVTWDAAEYSSGVYLYRLSTAERNETKKMILLK
ncbi:MAG: PKD domain-containing protein [candidate division Zixibacteria bacterium]|jgi:PKD repeat protein|nr:PKD domain-containing protein [candidate division Zixibacteria bacterium]